MKNVAVVGKESFIDIFNICGAEEIFKIDETQNLEKLINELAKEYKIILVEEEILNENKDIFLKYKNLKLPAISSIPILKEKNSEDYINSIIKKIIGNELSL